MDKVIIIGAGRHGREVYSYLQHIQERGEVNIVGFVDELKSKGKFKNTRILGNINDLRAYLEKNNNDVFRYITAIGDINMRQRVVNRIELFQLPNIHPFTLVHPTASVGEDVEIGEGTCIAPGSVITTHVRIGKHCIVNTSVSISHDCMVGDFVNLNPSVTLCGDVKMGNECFIGAGATVIDKINIGNRVTVGAGAVVTKGVQDNITVVGVPAKITKVGRAKK